MIAEVSSARMQIVFKLVACELSTAAIPLDASFPELIRYAQVKANELSETIEKRKQASLRQEEESKAIQANSSPVAQVTQTVDKALSIVAPSQREEFKEELQEIADAPNACALYGFDEDF